jgi:ribosome-binding protein aMBF1 (putative translation factor)
MAECFRCGISEDKTKLYNAISGKGIVKICGNCASIENFPIIKKPVIENQIVPQKPLIKDRLIRMSNPPIGREISLRALVDREKPKMQNHPDIIDNFHWTIQRIRRARKITREQFAKGIDEPESKVRMIEQGFLPESDYKIINKIENYLGVSLRKPGTSGFPNTDAQKKYVLDNSLITEKLPQKNLGFDAPSTRQLNISDLKEMKRKYEEEKRKDDSINSWEEEYSQDDERFLDEEFEKEFGKT